MAGQLVGTGCKKPSANATIMVKLRILQKVIPFEEHGKA
jgi:hypothetical protein